MTVQHYDDMDINDSILLDLPFREGVGVVTQDVAKPHHPITMANTPTWTTLGSGLGVLTPNGTNEYLQCLGASCADLNFMAGDYSVGGWINWSLGDSSQILIARYELSISGWEVYLTNSGSLNYLTLRHHHAAGLAVRTAAYSLGWTPGSNHFFGISRSGTSAQFYRDGEAVATVSDVLIDPETCAEDLVIGVRFTKDSNYYKGNQWRPRLWDEALTLKQWRSIYEIEKGWFA